MMWHLVLRTGVTEGRDEHSGYFSFVVFAYSLNYSYTCRFQHSHSTPRDALLSMWKRPFICNNWQDSTVPQRCPVGLMSHSRTQKPNASDQKTAVSGHAIDWHLLLGIMEKWNWAKGDKGGGKKATPLRNNHRSSELGDSTPTSHSGRQKNNPVVEWLFIRGMKEVMVQLMTTSSSCDLNIN